MVGIAQPGQMVAPRKIIPIFALAHFTHHLATGSLVPLLPLIKLSFGLDYFQSGLLVSAFSLAYGFGGPPMAWLADRVSRRLLIATGLVGVAASAMAVGVSQSYSQLVALLVVMGLLGASYHAPASSLLSSMLSSRERGRSLGFHVLGGSLAFLVTPILAVAVASVASWNWAFILLSLPALVSAALLAIVARNPEAAAIKAALGQAKESTSPAEVVRLVGGIVLAAVAFQVAGSAFTAFLPLFLADVHGVDPSLAGMLGGLAIGAGVLGAPLGGALSDRLGRKPVIVGSLVSTGPLIYLVATAAYGPILIGAMVLYGITMAMRMAPIESFIADVIPLNRRATVLGVYYFLGQETAGVATPVVGRVIDNIGASLTFTVLAVLTTLLAGLLFLLRRRI